jgi:NADP-dependent 3-hydroxy acid dehydrogenase YdfG
MKERHSGHIINLCSIAGKESYANGNVYCGTKHAVDALTKGMRIDLLPYKVRVSQICPGAVETEFSLVRFKGDAERADNVYKGFTPLTAMDVADAILYMIKCPAHVNINDMVIMPTAQANSYTFYKEL